MGAHGGRGAEKGRRVRGRGRRSRGTGTVPAGRRPWGRQAGSGGGEWGSARAGLGTAPTQIGDGEERRRGTEAQRWRRAGMGTAATGSRGRCRGDGGLPTAGEGARGDGATVRAGGGRCPVVMRELRPLCQPPKTHRVPGQIRPCPGSGGGRGVTRALWGSPGTEPRGTKPAARDPPVPPHFFPSGPRALPPPPPGLHFP